MSPVISGGGGAGGPAAGKYVPVASAATLDTTTYNNNFGGKLATLVFPADNIGIAFAIAGDAFPRVCLLSDPEDGWYFGDGTFDPYVSNKAVSFNLSSFDGGTHGVWGMGRIKAFANSGLEVPAMEQLSPAMTIINGALNTQQFVSGTGAQVSGAADVETYTPVTFNPGAATTATCTVALSPDNVTYSTVGVETVPAGVALDGTIRIMRVRLPTSWYLKLTVNAQAVLGLTTYA